MLREGRSRRNIGRRRGEGSREAHLEWWSPRALGHHHWQCWAPRALWSLLLQDPSAPRALQAQVALLAVCIFSRTTEARNMTQMPWCSQAIPAPCQKHYTVQLQGQNRLRGSPYLTFTGSLLAYTVMLLSSTRLLFLTRRVPR